MKGLRCWFWASLARLAAAVLVAGSSEAATFTVRSTADSGGTCPGSTCTLRQAIATAGSGDTINFSIATPGTITLSSGGLVIDKNLTINGPGANQLIVQRSAANGTQTFRIFDILSGRSVNISGLTIANGSAVGFTGGGIRSRGELTLASSTVSGNSAELGGGISSETGATLRVVDSTITANSARLGGGINNNGVMMTIAKTTICGNSASQGGGGIANNSGTAGNSALSNCTISGNLGGEAGGGLDNLTGTFSMRNTILALNTAAIGPDVRTFMGSVTSEGYNLIGNNSGATIAATTGDQFGTASVPIDPLLGPLQDNGGPTRTRALLPGSRAIDKAALNPASSISSSRTDQRGFTRPIDSPTIANASGGDGLDIGAYEVQPEQLEGCSEINLVVSNSNDSGGGSLRAIIGSACVGSTITFAANVRGAIALTSGELVINKNLTINGPGANLLTVQRSAAPGTPAFRVFNIASPFRVFISGLTIANGNAPGLSGGGILNAGILTLTNVTVSGNSALNGGGIYNSFGSLYLTGSTISGNTLGSIIPGSGGGIFDQGGQVTLTNSTISGNTAHSSSNNDSGGGIITNVGFVSLTNSTVSGNTGDIGGGVRNINGGTVTSRNSIIALNTSANGPDFNGPLTSNGFNLIGNSAGAAITPSSFPDQIGVTEAELNLGPLQNNGGPTFTHAILANSRAIDKGNSSGATTDQRGFPRPNDLPSVLNAMGGDGNDIGAFEFGTSPTSLVNISTRLNVQTGDNVLIGGFIVTGTQPKKVIVRALGPSLNVGGNPVPGRLANTALELRDSAGGLIAQNDDWRTTQEAEIIASTVPPPNDLESAIVATLPANTSSFTAIVRGAGNTSGIGIIEVYDLDQAADSQLANISTRGVVQTGDNVMIGGIIIVGPASRRVIVRAIGPSLNVGGIPLVGRLLDTTLEIADQNGTTLASNDEWRATQENEIIATTVAPTDNHESAIVATLPAAAYTAIVRGKDGTTGIALVEAFGLAN